MADVFEEIAKKLNELPDDVVNAYKVASKKAINEAGKKLEINLKRGAGVGSKLSDKQYSQIIETKHSYTYEVDWANEFPKDVVNKNYGRDKDRPRRAGKRNYSTAPATYHDLAYIINTGVVSDDGKTIRAGTHFITKAWRNAKSWKKKQQIYFATELDILSRKYEEEK